MKYKQPKIFDISKRETTLLDSLATKELWILGIALFQCGG